MKTELKLTETDHGKSFKTRSGEVVTVQFHEECSTYQWREGDGMARNWASCGQEREHREGPNDLVECLGEISEFLPEEFSIDTHKDEALRTAVQNRLINLGFNAHDVMHYTSHPLIFVCDNGRMVSSGTDGENYPRVTLEDLFLKKKFKKARPTIDLGGRTLTLEEGILSGRDFRASIGEIQAILNPTLSGHKIVVDTLNIGCQTLTQTDVFNLQKFLKEYSNVK